jgi:hypothetical protein
MAAGINSLIRVKVCGLFNTGFPFYRAWAQKAPASGFAALACRFLW